MILSDVVIQRCGCHPPKPPPSDRGGHAVMPQDDQCPDGLTTVCLYIHRQIRPAQAGRGHRSRPDATLFSR